MKELSHDGPSPGLMRQVTGEVMSTFTSDTEHIIKISELKKSFYVFHNATPSLSSYIKYVRSKKKKKVSAGSHLLRRLCCGCCFYMRTTTSAEGSGRRCVKLLWRTA